ncbi:MAG: hypothetical protein OEV40_29110, partial [Acidimicrobiia bacterium]|nr:hypothetical protein [Acidimicrobiia bacterium]
RPRQVEEVGVPGSGRDVRGAHDYIPTTGKEFAGALSPWAHLATVGAVNQFAPGGPDNSPDTAFLAIRPARARLAERSQSER